ncbi:hypothetical protein QT15_06050 [Pseudoalteromonas flavipulchra NCIMB 2033 = ATCC BAA-314]|nr:hypothetical protein QT15_06050 [Pseudoalteromonas flavipulchra NCIMB 2033 = ATCC BAA-314]
MIYVNQKGMTKTMKVRALSKAENERVRGGSLGVIKDDPRGSSVSSSDINFLPSGSRKVK